jgi:hypothetical protein
VIAGEIFLTECVRINEERRLLHAAEKKTALALSTLRETHTKFDYLLLLSRVELVRSEGWGNKYILKPPRALAYYALLFLAAVNFFSR